MNLNKALLFLISVIFIFVSIFMIKHEINDVAKKYLPIKVQSIIKILKNYKSFSKRLNNDYNVNFLPIYQTTVVRFMEHLTGNKVLLQLYPFVHQSLTPY